jgi:hypothetical protein
MKMFNSCYVVGYIVGELAQFSHFQAMNILVELFASCSNSIYNVIIILDGIIYNFDYC